MRVSRYGNATVEDHEKFNVFFNLKIKLNSKRKSGKKLNRAYVTTRRPFFWYCLSITKLQKAVKNVGATMMNAKMQLKMVRNFGEIV